MKGERKGVKKGIFSVIGGKIFHFKRGGGNDFRGKYVPLSKGKLAAEQVTILVVLLL